MNIIYFIYLVLISGMLSSFMFLFKPHVISLIIGGSVVTALAIIFETLVLDYTSDLFLLLIAAPVIEEILKLLATSYGKGIKNAIGVGTGFAIVENAFYLISIISIYSISSAIPYIIARAIGDPLLHSTSTSISIQSWQGNKTALPKAIGLHFLYNFWAVMIAGMSGLLRYEPIVIILLAILFVYKTHINWWPKIRTKWKVEHEI